MKKGLLGGTALIGAAALMAGAAGAAEAPEYKLSGNMNFQFYWVDQDWNFMETNGSVGDFDGFINEPQNGPDDISQDHGWYFGVDEAELALNVSGAADNGLKYGFKVEIQVNTSDGTVADEARIQLGGSWGTLQLGDEDGAEDTMNYGGENLMGATGGFDGDQDDYLLRLFVTRDGNADFTIPGNDPRVWFSEGDVIGAPSYPTIAGDTSDKTKISYYSPRFSGFQVGASITPTPNDGDGFKEDGAWENHYGIGANYDNSFGSLRIRASAVYSAATSNSLRIEDVAAFSVGGIVGWGPFSIGGSYTDNAESGMPIADDDDVGGDQYIPTGMETSYWNVAASFETGPMSFAAGYFVSTLDWGRLAPDLSFSADEATYEHIALTADYTAAPGLGFYAEVNLITDDPGIGTGWDAGDPENSVTSFILGANVSF